MEGQDQNKVSFLSKRGYHDLKLYSACLKEYNNNIGKEIELKTKTPLFLDANVLLRYYEISLVAREKLFNFISSNRTRIFLTHQVQQEFIRNRELVIDNFFKGVTAKIPETFSSEVLNKIQNFLNQNKIILKDYTDFEKNVSDAKEKLEEAKISIDDKIKNLGIDYKRLKYEDKYLDLINKCNILESLDVGRLESIKTDFDLLKKEIPDGKTEIILKSKNLIFPGLGDIKKKPEDPYGDYIIIHEIMNYMSSYNDNVVFLTFDTTKEDWMTISKEPYLHYLENVYYNTGKIIHILDADRTLEKVLDVDLESLIEVEHQSKTNVLTCANLMYYCETHPILKKFKRTLFLEQHIVELNAAGYETIEDFNIGISGIDEEYLKSLIDGKVTHLGALRFGLIPYNKNYKKIYLRLTKKMVPVSTKYGDKYLNWIVN